MSDETPDSSPMDVDLRSVCAACGHINDEATEFCLNCGAPLALAAARLALDAADPTNSRKRAWRVFGITTAFLGRDRELEQIMDIVSTCVEKKTRATIMIRGREGIGKSRMLDAIAAKLSEHAASNDLLVLRGQTRATDATPFGPVEEMIRQRFYIPDDAGDVEWRTRLEEGALSIVGPARGGAIASAIAPLVGLDVDTNTARSGPSRSPDAALRALTTLLREDAKQNPLVLLLDDLDEALPETRSLIGRLHSELADSPVILVGCATEEFQAGHLSIFPADPALHIVPLEPLADETIAKLVRHLLHRVDELPEPVVTFVTDRALGNPLSAEEIVRILIAEGVIDTRGNRWRAVTENLEIIDLPFEFESLVQARLDRLSAAERELLENAAIIGPTFWLGAIIVIDRMSLDDNDDVDTLWRSRDRIKKLKSTLQRAVDRDIVRVRHDNELPYEQAYTFKHAVEQRLLYDGVNPERAQAAHRRLAQWLSVQSTDHPERFVARIADHFALGDRPGRAAPWFLRAADSAKDRYANDQAITWYERAIACADEEDIEIRFDAMHGLGSLHDRLANYERSIPVFTELARLSWRVASRAKGGVAFNKLGRSHRSLGNYDQAKHYLTVALELFEFVQDRAGIASTMDDLGRIDWIQGNYAAAEDRYDRALSLRREVGDPRSIALSLNHLGSLRVQRGQFRPALALFREALELRRAAGDLQGIAESLNTIGVIFVERGDIEAAVKLWREALDAANEAGDRALQAVLLNNLGETAVSQGLLDEAEEQLGKAAALADSCGDRRVVFDATRNLGVLQAKRANRQLALAHAEEALDLARTLDSRTLEGIAQRTLGEILAQTVFDSSGDAESATSEHAFKEAIEIFQELGVDAELGRTYQSYGTYLLEQGILVQGKKFLEMAKEIFERLQMRRVLQQTTETITAL